MLSYSVLFINKMLCTAEAFSGIWTKLLEQKLVILKKNNLKFGTNFENLGLMFPKGYFWSKIKELNIVIKFRKFESVEVPNFTWNKQFWIKFTQKRYFSSIIEQMKITIGFSTFELFLEPSFILNSQFWFFGPNLCWKVIFGSK